MVYFKLHLIRHGLTAGNLEGRYIGAGTDLPLCDEGRAQLAALKRDFTYPPVELVFTSPLLRATETADILFPGVRQIPLRDLREMDFGEFEGRQVAELAKDPAFAAWMDPTSDAVPKGAESRAAFARRTEGMLMKLFEFMIKDHIREAACVTHGGVIMNMLARHALPQRRPEDWMTDPGAGYSVRLDTAMWMRDHLAEAYDIVPAGYLDGMEEAQG
ncbi:MAG TPA: histidine phosphatase family protein [Candidatus Gemmiger avicola]|uniref:Histidine phosphatase family protein n=1 Tax=Candidatus Gemmiger avicola TaxID=2838605 RepID=A0A9D2S2G3_9FIRM|nr:histidine phosphatase family protein [Candidatus Gemmiger avicola]